MSASSLVAALEHTAELTKDQFIFLRADRAVAYGDLMDVMELLRTGGYQRIKLVALEGTPAAAAPAPENAKP